MSLGQEELSVAIRRSNRARRLILRLDNVSGQPILTVPAKTGLSQAQDFLDRQRGWIANQRRKLPEAKPFEPGLTFPLRGEACRIVHRGGRGLVRYEQTGEEPTIIVPGDVRHLPRRLSDWLKSEARADLDTAVQRCTNQIGRAANKIRIGDTKSRWGSCSSTGTLSFSWRLIFAPPSVLNYLAAHETAHLIEMNHGPAFWALVERLDPDFDRAQRWVKTHGPGLHLIGRGRNVAP